MANISRFIPLDGVPDADARGIGTFLFDDGETMTAEDPELAQLVKSYQDELPQLEAAAAKGPDLRTASNDDPIASLFGENPLDTIRGAVTSAPFRQAVGAALPAGVGDALGAAGALREANRTASDVAAPTPGFNMEQDAAQQGAPDVAPSAEGRARVAPPPEPTDAQKAAELHRIAGDQALRGGYVAPTAGGWQEAQRTGAIPEDMAARQLDDRDKALESVISATDQAAADEAAALRKAALHEQMRLTVQREDQERAAREAEARQARLREDRRKINDAQIDTSFAQGNRFAQVMGVLGAALLGAIGSDAGLKMIENNIDQHVRKEMQIRGSKLQALAEELGSEEEVIAAAKAKIYEITEKQIAVQQKYLDAAGIEHKAPVIRAAMRQRHVDENAAQERANLGKTTEVYQQARAGGRTGPNLDKAAKHYEQAGKLSTGPEKTKAQADKEKAVSELRRLRDTLRRGQRSGDLAKVVGLIDQPLSRGQRKVGSLKPGQLEQLTTLEELQVGNLMRLVREPNNKRTQDMVQQIGNPQSDAEIDVAISRLDQLIALEEQAPVAMPEPVEIR